MMWRWLCSPHGRRIIAVKLVISGCIVAVLFHPQIGQMLSAGGSLLWLWLKLEN